MPPILDHEHDDTTVLEERPEPVKAPPNVKAPPKFVCVLKNDDFTPMEFVIDVLVLIFKHTPDEAEAIMLAVHHKGQGVAGKPSSRDVAETRRASTLEFAKNEGHPLQCFLQEV